MSGSEGAMATSPIETLVSFSKTHDQLAPLLVVFHRPPVAAATYMVEGWLSTMVRAEMRPPMLAGPMGRIGSDSRICRSNVGSADRAVDAATAEIRKGANNQWTIRFMRLQ